MRLNKYSIYWGDVGMYDSGRSADQRMTIRQWHEQTLSGRFIPLHIPIHGVSMFPLIRYRRDPVTIVPLKEPPVVGDIVLFHDPWGDRYVLHRVIEIDAETVLTRGDNCVAPDRRMPVEQVWGKVVLIERGKREITPDPLKGMRLARAWYTIGKGYRFAQRIRAAIARRVKRILGIGEK